MKLIHLFLTALLIFIVWGFFFQPLQVEKVDLEIIDLPRSFSGLKIAQISDIHSKEGDALSVLENLSFDYLVVTGDWISRGDEHLVLFADFWKELGKRYPGKVFGVLGNHDHDNNQTEFLETLLEQANINILRNEAVKIEKQGDYIYLVGIDDARTRHDDADKAFQGLDKDSMKLVISHSPEVFRSLKQRKDVFLVLTGHTHGAQIDIPVLSRIIIPLRHDRKYKEGLFKENSIYLYVNRGIGTTLIPFRFNSSPEITVFQLLPKSY